jgi:segregation and condensation protein B
LGRFGLTHLDSGPMSQSAAGEPSSHPLAEPLPAADPAPVPDSDVEDLDVVNLDSLPSGARGAVEAVLMVVEEPITEVQLAQALDRSVGEVAEMVRGLAADYDEDGRGFDLRQVAGGWRVFSRAEYASVVERFVVGGQQARLTQAALETLAVVAYRQPVSRARVGAVRGVNVDGVMRTLVARGLVEEDGTDGASGAILYRTTSTFLERLGLVSLDQLPALAPYLPDIDALDEPVGSST